MKICPFCKEQIREEALKCRFCGEWFDEGTLRTTAPQSDAKSRASGGANTGAVAAGTANLASQRPEAASSTPIPAQSATAAEAVGKRHRQSGSWKDYWYGYLYIVFCGYLTYCAATHLLVTALNPPPFGDVQRQAYYWTGLVLWTGATAFFAYVTYTIARRRVRMGLIYAVVTLHGINVLFRGIIPSELAIWAVLSWGVVIKFRERMHLQAEEASEALAYALLERATSLETKGRLQEALKAYRELAEKYSNTAAGQDAQKSLESLQSKVGKEIG